VITHADDLRLFLARGTGRARHARLRLFLIDRLLPDLLDRFLLGLGRLRTLLSAARAGPAITFTAFGPGLGVPGARLARFAGFARFAPVTANRFARSAAARSAIAAAGSETAVLVHFLLRRLAAKPFNLFAAQFFYCPHRLNVARRH
jgi:hypothetical protein